MAGTGRIKHEGARRLLLMQMRTMEKLAQALLKAKAPAAMVQRARQGYYDSYESPLAAPLMQLRQDALEVWLTGIAQRVLDGDFDATSEEANAWMEKEGKTILKEAGLNPETLFPG